tara:strand:+ start:336 stop:605 length:270 start_codon:yes stop_codon:yes gene_type:complete
VERHILLLEVVKEQVVLLLMEAMVAQVVADHNQQVQEQDKEEMETLHQQVRLKDMVEETLAVAEVVILLLAEVVDTVQLVKSEPLMDLV